MPVPDISAQLCKGVIGSGMAAREYVAYAAPALQPDIPNPAMLLRCRDGVRDDVVLWIVIGHLQSQRAIDKQHIAALDERHLQCLAEQPRPEARGVDEKVGLQPARLAGFHRVDIARVAFDYPGHFIDDVTDTQILDAMITDERGEAAGVEVIGVVGDAGILRRGDQFGREAPLTDRLLKTDRIRKRGRARVLFRVLRPEGCEIETWKTLGKHQRMIVEVILLTGHPARELRPLPERSVAFAKKVRFREAHLLQGGSHRLPGPFTYTDYADGLTFDQRDP